MASGRAKVVMDLKTSKFQQGLAKAHTQWKGFTSTIMSAKTMFAGVLAGVGVAKLVSFGKQAIDLARIQQDAETGLAAALRERNAYTKESFQDLTNYASALQKVTAHGDEETISVMRTLAQFGILGDKLKQATKLTLDMADSGKALSGSAELIGRSFIGNYGLLSRYGIQLDKIKDGGDEFANVLRELTKLYGGQAEAIAKTDVRKLDRIVMAWGDMQEHIGAGLATGMSEIAAALFDGAEGVERFNEENKKLMESGIAEAVLEIGDAVAYLVGWLLKVEAVASAAATPLKLLTAGAYVPYKMLRGKGLGEALGEHFGGFIDTWQTADRAFAASESMASRAAGVAYRRENPEAVQAFEEAMKATREAMRSLKATADDIKAEAAAAGG